MHAIAFGLGAVISPLRTGKARCGIRNTGASTSASFRSASVRLYARAGGGNGSDGGEKRTIVVYGGGSTLGSELVARFSTVGWRVVTLDHYDASQECGGVNGCAVDLDGTGNIPITLALPAGAPARTQAAVARRCLFGVLGKTRADVMEIVCSMLGSTCNELRWSRRWSRLRWLPSTSRRAGC